MKLTKKQQKFCDYYIQTGNATESYKRAGYACSNDNIAGVESHKLLRNPKVKAYIVKINEKLEQDRIANMKEIKAIWIGPLREIPGYGILENGVQVVFPENIYSEFKKKNWVVKKPKKKKE